MPDPTPAPPAPAPATSKPAPAPKSSSSIAQLRKDYEKIAAQVTAAAKAEEGKEVMAKLREQKRDAFNAWHEAVEAAKPQPVVPPESMAHGGYIIPPSEHLPPLN